MRKKSGSCVSLTAQIYPEKTPGRKDAVYIVKVDGV